MIDEILSSIIVVSNAVEVLFKVLKMIIIVKYGATKAVLVEEAAGAKDNVHVKKDADAAFFGSK
ncbi:hypothetical protein [Bacillus sp. 03113]|uniref:hypothetical protein n=1 Tax=Bacillus sp. 03113 TaxID=2578211 RepID=UPI0015E8DB4C|nr:hypothetical protein [Bacillus sp. 03113]